MRVLRAADYRTMPWKNGDGTTHEIAIFPPGASIDSFEWRLSMAEVREDGAFSNFPGIDRTLAIVSGEMSLSIDNGSPLVMTRTTAPLCFSGEASVQATLPVGPVRDLNIMTRRGRVMASMLRPPSEECADVTFVFATCKMTIQTTNGHVDLSACDTLHLEKAESFKASDAGAIIVSLYLTCS